MDRCPTCNRTLPGEHDGSAGSGPARSRWCVSEPPGEGGILEDLFIQFYERFQPRWEADHDMPTLGGRGYKYRGLHHLLYAVTTAPEDVIDRLFPSETGA